MQIGAKKAVTFHYSLRDDDGTVLDSSDGRAPLTYLHGEGNIVPGLEKALEGKQAGDEVKATVPPEEGYGKRDESNIRNIPRRKLPEGKLAPGMRMQLRTDQGPLVATVLAVKGDYVTLDANHPLADKTLHFDVKVVDVRDATDEELAHGHVHGPGAHH
ncbi:MAG TPA: peptidylprolyl isomerase [Polyangia bacterium]|jgi:FKBP-type peptidyl-prolyl cis-trans isomerase SlyD